LYDAAGNTLYDGMNEYWYDAEGQLCAVQSTRYGNGTIIQYVYDSEGARIAKGTLSSAPGAYSTCAPPSASGATLSSSAGLALTNRYLVDLGGEQVTEFSEGGSETWQHSNIWVGSRLTATLDRSGLHFELADPLGTKREQVNVSGVVENRWTSLPFGNDLNNPPSYSAPDATEHHFTGKERDAESGNDYFEARYYSSAMGRFTTPDWSAKTDPVPYAVFGDPQSLNLYAYVRNNPLVRLDPDGHGCNGWGCLQQAQTEAEKRLNMTEAQQKAQQQSQNSPLTDKSGNVVQGANGKPALIPNGFDVNAVVQSGKATGELRGVAPMVGAKATSEDLANFGRGGKWDLQRLSGNFDPRYIDSATILIGMYAASSHITRNQILDIENFVARGSTYAKGTVMDSTYTHLPVRNVTNTDIGMRLIQSGAYVP